MVKGAASMTLDEIALSLDPVPDKSSLGHGYTQHYDRHLSQFRGKRLRMLEVGVWEGISLAMWELYFPKAKIFGADIDIKRAKYHDPARSFLWEMNQASETSLKNMVQEIGPWDIIIDDGSHDPKDQVLTFETLWPYLNPGGVYAIEDLHANYFNHDTSAVRFIGGVLQDDVHGRGKTTYGSVRNSSLKEQSSLAGRERDLLEMHIYRFMCIMVKGT